MEENNIKKDNRTSLYQRHLDLNAKINIFANYKMPINYPRGIQFEYNAIRNNVGLFDVSHMGIIKVSGQGSGSFLNKILSNSIERLHSGEAMYTLLCNHKGGVVDDLIIYHIDDYFILIINASNKEKNLEWIIENNIDNVKIEDISEDTSLVAIQGPNSKSKLESVFGFDISDLKFYSCRMDTINSQEIFIARTGYTGELGYEIFGSPKIINYIWDQMINNDVFPAGLAVRDVLRIEMGYCLYGHEINQNINPIDAGLSWILKKSSDFIGKDAIFNPDNQKQQVIFIRMLERGIPREGCQIFIDDKEVGFITSGTFSYLLDCGLGIGFIDRSVSNFSKGSVLIRNNKIPVEIRRKAFIDNRSLRRD